MNQSLTLCLAETGATHYCATPQLGDSSYFPPSAPQLSNKRLFGMFHSGTPAYNKEVILTSMKDPFGVVCVVFTTITLGMGVNFARLNNTIHYGVPQSLDDYFQESGHAGRTAESAKPTIFWKPFDVPQRHNQKDPRNPELSLAAEIS